MLPISNLSLSSYRNFLRNDRYALIYLDLGQSNCGGRMEEANLPANRDFFANPISGIKTWMDSEYTFEDIHLGDNIESDFDGGPGLEAAYQLRLALDALGIAKDIHVLKHYANGTRLAADTGNDWHPDSSKESFYEMLLKKRKMFDWFQANNLIPFVVWVSWYQGETDALTQEYAETFEENLKILYNSLFKETRVPNVILPPFQFVIPRIWDVYTYSGGATGVRQQAIDFATAHPYAAWVNSDDATAYDSQHADTAGNILVGGRIGTSFSMDGIPIQS